MKDCPDCATYERREEIAKQVRREDARFHREEIAELRAQLTAMQKVVDATVEVLKYLPELSCDNFRHAKKDQHDGGICPVSVRYYTALALLRFRIRELKETTK